MLTNWPAPQRGWHGQPGKAANALGALASLNWHQIQRRLLNQESWLVLTWFHIWHGSYLIVQRIKMFEPDLNRIRFWNRRIAKNISSKLSFKHSFTKQTSLVPSLPILRKPPPARSASCLLAAPSSPRKGSCSQEREGFRSSRRTRRRTAWARSMAMHGLGGSEWPCAGSKSSFDCSIQLLLLTYVIRHNCYQLWQVLTPLSYDYDCCSIRLKIHVFVFRILSGLSDPS